MTTFLEELQAAMTQPDNARHVVAIQATPSATANIIAGPPGTGRLRTATGATCRGGCARPILIVNGAAVDNDAHRRRTLVLLAICADARSKIESDMLVSLASARPDYQLGGLTYALLYGTR